MCKSRSEPGGPRRCSGDTRATYERASAAVATLEDTERDLLDKLSTGNDSPAPASHDGAAPGPSAGDDAPGHPGGPEPEHRDPVSFTDKTTRVEDIRREIEEAMDRLDTGDAWQAYLDNAGKFHNYSLNNQMLIMMQKPEATQVAGFNKWKEMGRSVNKGEKAIWIQAPMVVRKKTDDPDSDERRVIGFKPVPVYDVSQTSGKPLPKPPVVYTQEHGEAPAGMVDDLSEQIKSHGYTVDYEDLGADATARDGYTDPVGKRVVINTNRSSAHQAMTLAHELGHIDLGHMERMHDYTRGGQRPTMEVEAESVAYVIGRHYGYKPVNPFGYIDGWAKGDKSLVKSTATNVCASSKRILSKLTTTSTESG